MTCFRCPSSSHRTFYHLGWRGTELVLTHESGSLHFQEFCKLLINNVPNLATAQKSKTMASTVATNSAQAERDANLVIIICMRMRNSLIADDISNLTTILLLGMGCSSVKSWSNCNHSLATDARVWQKSSMTFWGNQLTIWHIQSRVLQILLLFGNCVLHVFTIIAPPLQPVVKHLPPLGDRPLTDTQIIHN